MKWEEFIKIVGSLPVIETEILLAGTSDFKSVKIQISRWQKAGKLIQAKRGIYLLCMPYRKVNIYEPYLASVLKRPSYLSLEKALEFHSLIPEAVPAYTSVTTRRPGRFISEVGTFNYQHIKNSLFWGYDAVTVSNQTAFIASPEKALLDFFYLRGVKISLECLDELRLQNLEKVNFNKLFKYAKRFEKPGIRRVAEMIRKHIDFHKGEEKTL